MRFLTCCLLSSAVAIPAAADAFTLKPIIDARLRYETVDQTGSPQKANAVTARARLGVEATNGPFSFLVESEATMAIDKDYFSGVNTKSATFPIVADPENIELNRIQIQYKGLPKTIVTVGRQRINLDDQRFVGAAGWRDNEQTFDAVRAEWTAIPNLKVDLTYSWSDRTIYGIDGGKNGFTQRPQSIDGDNVFANAAYKFKYGTLTGFYYRVDENEPVAALLRNSSQTFGGRFAGSYPFTKQVKFSYVGSYARQSSIDTNTLRYAANYFLADVALDVAALKFGAGFESLGHDNSVTTKAAVFRPTGFSVQTPFATLHKFQGWADKFLTTPDAGLNDYYGSIGYGWKKVGPFDTIGTTAIYHRFESIAGNIRYGDEIDLQLLAKVKKYTFTAKYADFDGRGVAGFVTTKKFWLSGEWSF
jgi:hypothetical protein